MDKLTDRLALWVLRLFATAMLFAGASGLLAAMPLAGMLMSSPAARTIAGFLFQLSIVFVIAGATAIYLSRPRGLLLPNERALTSDAERTEVGGWLIALAIVLVALPIWLVLRLQPFLVEWGTVADFLANSDLWKGANANGAGLVLLPLAAALTPPLFELAALVAFVAASAMSLMLLPSRSVRFPRVYVTCAVLLSALVIASVRGADAVMVARQVAQQLIQGSSGGVKETAQLTEGLDRYTNIVSSTAPLLVWALGGYLIWVPLMIFSSRVRTTFAGGAGVTVPTPARATDIEAITSPPRFPD